MGARRAITSTAVWLVVGPAVLILSAAAVLLGQRFFYRLDLPYECDLRPFDAEEWRSSSPGLRSPRLGMIEDLISSRVLLGKTRPELEEMLGRGNDTMPGEWDIRFFAGGRDLSRHFFEPWLLDTTTVVVRLDEDGRVAEADLAFD